jgi:hypothetical protein
LAWESLLPLSTIAASGIFESAAHGGRKAWIWKNQYSNQFFQFGISVKACNYLYMKRNPHANSSPRQVVALFGIMLAAGICGDFPADAAVKASFVSVSANREQYDALDLNDFIGLIEEGKKPEAPTVEELAIKLQKDPTDLPTRLRLLGKQRHREKMPAQSVQLLLGVIKHNPRAIGTGPICIILSPLYDRDALLEGIELWRNATEANPNDAQILGNAAQWMDAITMVKPEYQEKSTTLFERARALEPMNPAWAAHLGGALLKEARGLKPPQSVAVAKKAREQFEAAYQLLDPSSRVSFRPLDQNYLGILAEVSLLADETENAKGFAIELLKTIDEKNETWNYGNLIHNYNLFLGKIALNEGKTDVAGQYLIAAGRTPGSPQLNSFGPTMSLAKALLEKGAREPVLSYLDLCANFWKLEEGRLGKWKRQIQDGETPDFGVRAR